MAFPITQIDISLLPATPTKLTAVGLKTQLTNMGMTCDDTLLANLEDYITEVKAQIPNGAVQTWAIMKPASAAALTSLAGTSLLGNLAESSVGNWTPDSVGKFQTMLIFMQLEEHFNWLKANRPNFPGIVADIPKYQGVVATIDGIKRVFVQVGTDGASTVIKGLDKASLESVLSNAISLPDPASAHDYHSKPEDSVRTICLVDNYDSVNHQAAGIGVLAIEWDLTIKDYLVKKQAPTHDTALTVKARSVLYTDADAFAADFAAVSAHFKARAFALQGFPIDTPKVTIFPKRPEPVKATFDQGILKKSTVTEVEVVVLYAPDLQVIGSIDNTGSDTTTTYEQSVTTGFTFETTQELSIAGTVEANFEVVKASVTVTASISFTEQWSKSGTISMSFEVPGGKKAFNYQGYIMAEILRYDAKADTYSYQGGAARCLTNVLTSRNTPLV